MRENTVLMGICQYEEKRIQQKSARRHATHWNTRRKRTEKRNYTQESISIAASLALHRGAGNAQYYIKA